MSRSTHAAGGAKRRPSGPAKRPRGQPRRSSGRSGCAYIPPPPGAKGLIEFIAARFSAKRLQFNSVEKKLRSERSGKPRPLLYAQKKRVPNGARLTCVRALLPVLIDSEVTEG